MIKSIGGFDTTTRKSVLIGVSIIAVMATSVFGFGFMSSKSATTAQAIGLTTTTTSSIGTNGSIIGNATITPLSTNSSVLEIPAQGNAKNEYYIFTQELNANEDKVGVPVAVYSVNTIVAHNGDNITIHFLNAAVEPDDRHTFTMLAPYKMDYDLAGGQNKTFSFIANTTGGFTYYCRYDLPSMTGHLEVLP
jgi:plastocyanin